MNGCDSTRKDGQMVNGNVCKVVGPGKRTMVHSKVLIKGAVWQYCLSE